MSRRVLASCVLLVLALSAGLLAAGCGPVTKDDPALAAQAQKAIDATGGSAAVRGITADSDGHVIVTLNAPKEGMGSEADARDGASVVASTIFDGAPAAKTVSVFDGNNKMIETYTLK